MLDNSGKLDDETVRVILSVLCDLQPPTNPAVVLCAMRNWYLAYGNGPVLLAFMDWLSQLTGFIETGHYEAYLNGQKDFQEKTGIVIQPVVKGTTNVI